jgi:hypothetical protein
VLVATVRRPNTADLGPGESGVPMAQNQRAPRAMIVGTLACLHGNLAVAEPKTLRWTLWHTPARLVRRARRRVVRILDGWPTATEITNAHHRVALIT